MKLNTLTKFLILLFTLSCTSKVEPLEQVETGIVIKDNEVAFKIDNNITRTQIADDMITTKWSNNDKIYLWAYNTADESTPYNNSEFSLRYYGDDFDEAAFIGNSVATDNTASYRYYAVYPKPAKVSGSSVTFNISGEQDGAYNTGAYDIMASEAVVGSAFKEGVTSDLILPFKHLTHSLCIKIPEYRNYLKDKVKTLEIEFPCDVVGDVTFDVKGLTDDGQPLKANPKTTFSNGSNIVTLTFEEPIEEGDYAWVFVNPTTVDGVITFRAIDVNGYKAEDITTYMSNRSLEAGRVTPINLSIPKELSYTTLNLKIAGNNLGEDPDSVIFTAPEGALFRNGSAVITEKYKLNSEYTVSYYTSLYGDSFKKDGLKVTYDSPNTLTNQTVALSNVSDDKVNSYSNLAVPYLMSNDFSGIPSFERGTNPGGSSAVHVPVSLDEYNLTGWTGDRVGGLAGKSIRTMCRLEGGLWAQALYKGRIDSAPLSCIKEGKTVKIHVSYNVSGSEDEYAGSKNGTPKFYHGYTSIAGTLSSHDDEYPSIEHQMGGVMEQGTSGSYTKNGTPKSYTSNLDVSSETRLSWFATVSRGTEFAQGGNYWLYIDNVTVKIVK